MIKKILFLCLSLTFGVSSLFGTVEIGNSNDETRVMSVKNSGKDDEIKGKDETDEDILLLGFEPSIEENEM